MSIKDLNPAIPTDTDPVGQGDDHIRQIKDAITEAFGTPTGQGGIDGPILKNNGAYPTSKEWSDLFESTDKFGAPGTVFFGCICGFWQYAAPDPTTGWHECDGTTVQTKFGAVPTPDLRGYFLVGGKAGDPDFTIGQYGGGKPVPSAPSEGSGATNAETLPPYFGVRWFIFLGAP